MDIKIDFEGIIKKIEDLRSNTFSGMVEELSLDPSRDFVNSDLVGVDFSNSDLRGYNFSGADLRGSFGINISGLDDIILEYADTENSPFSFIIDKKQFFDIEDNWTSNYRRMLKADWMQKSLWVHDVLHRNKDRSDRAISSIRLLFENTDDGTAKYNILLFLLKASDDKKDNLDFMMYIIAKHGIAHKNGKMALRVMSDYWNNNELAFEFMLKVATTDSENIAARVIASDGVIKSKLMLRKYVNDFEVFRRMPHHVHMKVIDKVLPAYSREISDAFNSIGLRPILGMRVTIVRFFMMVIGSFHRKNSLYEMAQRAADARSDALGLTKSRGRRQLVIFDEDISRLERESLERYVFEYTNFSNHQANSLIANFHETYRGEMMIEFSIILQKMRDNKLLYIDSEVEITP